MESTVAAGRAMASGDAALVARAAGGDATAFDALVASRLDRCYRLAFAILGDAADAADATQEAFVTAWRQLPRLRDQGAFDHWLNRIVANAARMAGRRKRRVREVSAATVFAIEGVGEGEGRLVEPADARAGRQLDSVVATDAIGRAFDRLAERDRLLLVLHHVEERPVAEIAKTLGIPIGTAKWRLHQARAALALAMEAER